MERDLVIPVPLPAPWRASAALVGAQLLTVGVLVGLCLATVGAGWLPAAVALGVLLGARLHGLGRSLPRPAVRALSLRSGAALGGLLGLLWAAVAAVPGQVEVPLRAVPLVAAVLGVGAGFAACVLTLCGLDWAGRR